MGQLTELLEITNRYTGVVLISFASVEHDDALPPECRSHPQDVYPPGHTTFLRFSWRIFLLLQFALFAYNAFRIIEQFALKMKNLFPRKFTVSRHRLRSVMQDLIYIACKKGQYVWHITLKFWGKIPWFSVFKELYIL